MFTFLVSAQGQAADRSLCDYRTEGTVAAHACESRIKRSCLLQGVSCIFAICNVRHDPNRDEREVGHGGID